MILLNICFIIIHEPVKLLYRFARISLRTCEIRNFFKTSLTMSKILHLARFFYHKKDSRTPGSVYIVIKGTKNIERAR